jgi:pimeloyl-ACP methyl ester carboxylesterase
MTFLRSGKYTGTLGSPSKIVHVGHSFGSCISNALIATTPQLSDAAILTGIGYTEVATSGAFVEAFGLRIATLQAPGKWPGRDNEYVTWVDAPANAAAFFKAVVMTRKSSGILRLRSNLWQLLSFLLLRSCQNFFRVYQACYGAYNNLLIYSFSIHWFEL